ncbi:uncharacterized protein Aud_003882 [Aspergillus udagawae]|uniref:Dipeptidase n=1 Tax=Aspergillus udagawae TaxID=91492 RepID=A0A8E0QN61_9EURO|nr:uncharacterized protein Aud_003882 [Aspergillus udagawae]GIC87498.1 hypothetical protein Aud_003882 [Aspergillus udagawae]
MATYTSVMRFIEPWSQNKGVPFIRTNAPPGYDYMNFEWVDCPVQITDARPTKDSFTLDQHGFTYRDDPAGATPEILQLLRDNNDAEKIRKVYYSHIEQLVKRETGASRVIIFDHTSRKRRPELGTYENPTGKEQPATMVHCDQSTKGALRRLQQNVPDHIEVLKNRVMMINIWRPLRGPVEDWPLATMDYRTCDPNLIYPTDLLDKADDYRGQTVTFGHADEQRWYYLDHQRPDEVTMIKIWDNQEGVEAKHGHNDFPIWIRAFYQNHIYQENFTYDGPLVGQVDFPRLAQGRLRGQFWSVYVECPKIANEYSDESYFEIQRDTLQQIDLVNRLVRAESDMLALVHSSTDVWETFSNQPTRIASVMGIEGLHQIANSASILRLYHRLGVRYATLTHECHNAFADSATPARPLHNGLSEAGRILVGEMNRLGMIVDLAHVSYETMLAALDVTTAPVIFSHSSAYALCPHERNVPDNILWKLKRNNGVVMVSFYPSYTRCDDPDRATIEDVADHIQYIGELIGYRHVGLGSDFDGMPARIRGLEDVSKYPDLISLLLRRGVGVKELAGVIGGNILRVLRAVEDEAASRADELPLEDDVKPFFS